MSTYLQRQSKNQLAARQAALAVGARYNQPASVGACSMYSGPGCDSGNCPTTPGNYPAQVPPMPPNSVIQNTMSPCGVRGTVPTSGASVTFQISPIGYYYICGVRTFNNANTVDVVTLIGGQSTVQLNACAFDAAAYNTNECFCPVDWGCASQTTPFEITVQAVSTQTVAPTFTAVLFGCWQQALGCYPPGWGPWGGGGGGSSAP
jgi:hypothetical protein